MVRGFQSTQMVDSAPSCVQFKKYCLLPVSEVTFISEAAADILNAV